MMMDNLCKKVEVLARSTGEYLKNEQAKLSIKDIELKGTRDYVTYIDKEAEKILVKGLKELFPVAGFLTEEETVNYEETEYTWIIDPLDGTTNYIHGDATYAVSIALKHKQDIVLGVVYDPIINEMYSATAPGNAKLNNNILKVSSHSTIENAFLGCGIPYELDSKGEQILQNAMRHIRSCSFRIKGSAALETCYVAAGITDAYFHSGLSAWDVAAGTFILKCAGGLSTDFSSGNNYLFGRELVASNGAIHNEIMKHIVNI